MLKTKIKIVLPYWLSALLIVMAAQNGIFLILGNQDFIKRFGESQQQNQPEVLGAFTEARGFEAPAADDAVKQIADLDLADISAKSFLAYDSGSGTVYAQKNPNEKLSIASLTKLLTGLVAYEKNSLNSTLVIGANDSVGIKPNLGLVLGDEIKIQDLINAMLIGSCNDAAQTLANHTEKLTDKNFVDLMNEKAVNLDMQDSKFSNPLGFDIRQNYSTASDLKKLVSATQHLPVFTNIGKSILYSFTSQKGLEYKTAATNKLIGQFPDLEAVKTGFTETAQGSMITRLNAGKHQIVLIILGSENREKDTLELRGQLLKNYQF